MTIVRFLIVVFAAIALRYGLGAGLPATLAWLGGERIGWLLMLAGSWILAHGLRLNQSVRAAAPVALGEVPSGRERLRVLRGGRRSA